MCRKQKKYRKRQQLSRSPEGTRTKRTTDRHTTTTSGNTMKQGFDKQTPRARLPGSGPGVMTPPTPYTAVHPNAHVYYHPHPWGYPPVVRWREPANMKDLKRIVLTETYIDRPGRTPISNGAIPFPFSTAATNRLSSSAELPFPAVPVGFSDQTIP